VLRMMAPRVAIKAKPNSSDSKSSDPKAREREPLSLVEGEHGAKRPKTASTKGWERQPKDPQPTSAQLDILAAGIPLAEVRSEAAPFREFSISLDMLGRNSLGIDVDWADGRSLLVKSVQMGPVADWNMERGPDKALRPGDRIVAVNGISGESIGAVALVQECKGKPHVQLTCRTQRPRPSQPLSRLPLVQPAPVVEAAPKKEDAAKASKPLKPKKGGNLYSFLPEADPENDSKAASRAAHDPFSEPAAAETPKLAIFLDIDGVLRRLEGRPVINLDGEVLPLHLISRKFEAEAMRALKWLVHKTGAGIVLSSEWRRDNTLREEAGATLRTQGLPPMRGLTPVFEPREEVAVGPKGSEEREKGAATMRLRWAERRAREISAYLRERPEVERWVALDDLDLSMADQPMFRLPETLWMAPGLALIDPETAFTMGDARKASEMLLKEL